MGSKTVFTVVGLGDDKSATFDIITADFMSSSFFPYSVPSSSDIASPGSSKLLDGFISEARLNDLANMVRVQLVGKLMPELVEDGAAAKERLRESVEGDGGRRVHETHEEMRRDEKGRERLREELGQDGGRLPSPGVRAGQPTPEGLRPPGWDDELEIMSGPRGGAYGGGMPGGRNPLSIGADDLNPPGLGPDPPLRGPFFGEGGVGGGMGGMHPGPDHPMFGGGQGPMNPR